MRLIAFPFLFLFLNGCMSTKDISSSEFVSNIAGACLTVESDLNVYFADTWPDSTYELIPPDALPPRSRSSLAPWKLAFVLEKGEQIKITKVLEHENTKMGGGCWKVYAKRLSDPAVEFMLPSCMYYQHKLWFKPENSHELNGESVIKMDTQYVSVSKCR